jgi:hypothetical protein
MSHFDKKERELIDSSGVNFDGKFMYRDFKISPKAGHDESTPDVSFNVATYVDDTGPAESIQRIVKDPSILKYNMDMYYDALESPQDDDNMFG